MAEDPSEWESRGALGQAGPASGAGAEAFNAYAKGKAARDLWAGSATHDGGAVVSGFGVLSKYVFYVGGFWAEAYLLYAFVFLRLIPRTWMVEEDIGGATSSFFQPHAEYSYPHPVAVIVFLFVLAVLLATWSKTRRYRWLVFLVEAVVALGLNFKSSEFAAGVDQITHPDTPFDHTSTMVVLGLLIWMALHRLWITRAMKQLLAGRS
jgi:hypothetical protein